MKTFTQKRAAAHLSLAFGETHFRYSLRFGPSVHEIVADYFEVARPRRHTARRDWSRLGNGLMLTLAGLGALAAQTVVAGASQWAALWLVPGLALISLFAFVRGHYVEMLAAGEPFWIIDNKSSRAIIAEIDRRRRDQLAAIYAPLNLANEPYLEIRKIEWLVEESVFTREQADMEIAKVHAHAADKAARQEEKQAMSGAGMFTREAIAI